MQKQEVKKDKRTDSEENFFKYMGMELKDINEW